MNPLVLMVDDEPDVEVLFRQHFRRDLRAERFTMEFAQSGPAALQHISDAAGVSLILILSDINMPGMSGLELLPRAKALRPHVPVIMRRCARFGLLCFQIVAGLSEQGWNVDDGERVGAGDDQNVSGLHSGEKTAGRSARPQAPRSHRELPPVPTICIQSYFAIGAGLNGNHDPSCAERGEGCAIIIFLPTLVAPRGGRVVP